MHLKRVTLFTILITFSLLILGGFVHNTESSLACPDWPLCYGQVFPKMEGGILIEHSHRLLASFVGLLTILMVFFAYKEKDKSDSHKKLLKYSWIALAMVILQGILGGITVIYKLPTIVSTSHLGLSMIYFSMLIFIHHQASMAQSNFWVMSEGDQVGFKANWKPALRQGVLVATILVYAQIILGAFMRHSGAGAACGLGPSSAIQCMDTALWVKTWWPSTSEAQLHMVHRIFAVIVTIVAAVASFRLSSFFKTRFFGPVRSRIITFGWLIVASLVAQVILGVLTVAKHISVAPTTAHLGMAAVCLGLLWKLNLILRSLEFSTFEKILPSNFSDTVDLTKPRLSGLVMMTVFAGMILAPGQINFFQALLSLFLIAMVVTGGAALNCYLEKDVDSKMERTKDRALPAGRLEMKTALIFGLILVGLGILGLVFWVNITTGVLAALAALLYLFAYTPMKQSSELAVYVGAIPGAIPPLLGWAAVMGEMDAMAWSLFAILFIWQLPHFMAISIYLVKDYDAASIKVYPNTKGRSATTRNIFLTTILLFVASCLPFLYGNAGTAYSYAAYTLSGAFLVLAMRGFFVQKSDEIYKSWAKKYFWGSIIYLPLLLGSMLFFN